MLIVLGALVGLMLGSFTNVLIVRVPAGRNWVSERSACPQCGASIRWYDNVPLVSWLVLRGRCRDCKARISVRYPIVELLVAVMIALAAAVFGWSFVLGLLALLAVVTVALVFIDIDVRRLPHVLVLPSIGVVLAGVVVADIAFHEGSAVRGLLGGAILGGFYGVLWLVYPKGMGFGDVTTAAMLGLVLGFLGWSSLAVGAIAGPLIGGVAVLVAMTAGKVTRKSAVPYGPFLIAGAWLGIYAGPKLASAYLSVLGATPGA